MKKNAVIEKNGKADRAKKKFLKELKESIAESNQASRGEIKLRTLEETITHIENTHGGQAYRSGPESKRGKENIQGVKLTAG